VQKRRGFWGIRPFFYVIRVIIGYIRLSTSRIYPIFFITSEILNFTSLLGYTPKMASIPGHIVNLQVDIQTLKQTFETYSGSDILDVLAKILENVKDLNTPATDTYTLLLILRDRVQTIDDLSGRRQARMNLTTLIQSLRIFLNWYWGLAEEDRHLVNYLDI